MTALAIPTSDQSALTSSVRLHRFTGEEYDRMIKAGVFEGRNPIEMLDGFLYIKLDFGPPYDVPMGIPPSYLVEGVRYPPEFPIRKFTVREYDRLLDAKILPTELRTELVDGWVVEKMTHNAKHASALRRLSKLLQVRIPSDWELSIQLPIQLDESRAEPDIAILRGPMANYDDCHPIPNDVGLVVEIADVSLYYDRNSKFRMYARNSLAVYWIVNLNTREVEVYSEPTGPTLVPEYRSKVTFAMGESVPLSVREQVLPPVPVLEIMPR